MTESSKPIFNKSSRTNFKGTDQDYDQCVWIAANNGMIDADDFRAAAEVGLDHADVVKAYNYLHPQPAPVAA